MATKDQYFCVYCDGIKACYRADRPSTHGCKSVAQLDGMTPQKAAWLEQRLGYRSRTVCKVCVPKMEGFIKDNTLSGSNTWSEKQQYVLALLEAFVDYEVFVV